MKAKKWSFRRPRHILARFVCLLLAVVFWLYVMYVSAPPYDATYQQIPVTVLESESIDYAVTVDPIASVRVIGSKMALYETEAEDIVATVSLADLAGTVALMPGRLYELKVSFKTPDGVTVDGDYTVFVKLSSKAETP